MTTTTNDMEPFIGQLYYHDICVGTHMASSISHITYDVETERDMSIARDSIYDANIYCHGGQYTYVSNRTYDVVDDRTSAPRNSIDDDDVISLANIREKCDYLFD